MKTGYWFLGILLVLILLEAARVYFIMPFPGSQLSDAANLSRVELAYWLHRYGYYHQVCDTVGGQSIMVTYCTVCHTGRNVRAGGHRSFQCPL